MSKNHKKNTEKRCSYSNKIVSNKEVVSVEYAIEYVKKMGYKVIPLRTEEAMRIFLTIFLVNGSLLLLNYYKTGGI